MRNAAAHTDKEFNKNQAEMAIEFIKNMLLKTNIYQNQDNE